MFYSLSKKTILVTVLCLILTWPAWSDIDGKKSFDDNCSGCHTIGGGPSVGPDLQDILKRRNHDWVIHYVQEPDELRNRKDATALELKKQFGDSEMPNLGLGHEEVEAIVEFMAQTAPAAVPAQIQVQGDAGRGRELFIGTTRFASGAPACLNCHSVRIPNMALGGTLGPDLTATADRLGPAGILNAIKSSPFPSMKPIYKNKPLSESEQNDLAAFFIEASANGGEAPKSYFLWAGSALALGLLALFNWIWSGRLRGVRKALVSKGVK